MFHLAELYPFFIREETGGDRKAPPLSCVSSVSPLDAQFGEDVDMVRGCGVHRFGQHASVSRAKCLLRQLGCG